jgi:hypothetical protein
MTAHIMAWLALPKLAAAAPYPIKVAQRDGVHLDCGRGYASLVHQSPGVVPWAPMGHWPRAAVGLFNLQSLEIVQTRE